MIRTGYSGMLLLTRLVLLRSRSLHMRCTEMHRDAKALLNALIRTLRLTIGMKSSAWDESYTRVSEPTVRSGSM